MLHKLLVSLTLSIRKYPKRGQVWICDLGINVGSEQNGSRPCVILNNPVRNERTCIILPASRTERLFSIRIDIFNFLVHQIRVVDSVRFQRIVKRLDKTEVDKLVMKIMEFLQ